MSSTYISSSKSFPPYEPTNKIPQFRSRFLKPNLLGCAEDDGVISVKDSKSLRQLYVRTAYTLTTPPAKHRKLYSRVKNKVNVVCKKGNNGRNKGFLVSNNKQRTTVKICSCGYVLSMVRRMLACTTKVDVASQ
ncbi:hypothetical protein RND81_01G114800 [Saponaria officinalis]|uniref:Uncharacterized protein n=1 Tax=Saponaria officinalis TaxID=3572 RepID=A0AAW1NET4_SAPOF